MIRHTRIMEARHVSGCRTLGLSNDDLHVTSSIRCKDSWMPCLFKTVPTFSFCYILTMAVSSDSVNSPVSNGLC